MTTELNSLLTAAFERRGALMQQLPSENTDCWRLFHGSVESWPGLTIDRYGDVILIQSFHAPLETDQLATIEACYEQLLPGLAVVYNDRSQGNSRVNNVLSPEQNEVAIYPRVIRELGVRYRFQARHDGQDPWLFLDLRAARRRVLQEAKGKSVLNLFAYTCGVGIAAASAGASQVLNVDFAASSLAVGKDNAGLNALPLAPRFLQCDAFAALRQLSGLGQPSMVRGKRMPAFPKLEPQQFDLVVLDPPRYAKSPFGVVDLVNDYAALFKPALLSTRDGGTLLCCNNVAQVSGEVWIEQLQRSARKAGRAISEVEWIKPEADFPSRDGHHPLKMALLRV